MELCTLSALCCNCSCVPCTKSDDVRQQMGRVQARSRAGRWSWARERVGLLQLFPNGGATGIVFVTLCCIAAGTAITWCSGRCAMPDGHCVVLAAVHGSLGLPGWRLFRGFTLLPPFSHSSPSLTGLFSPPWTLSSDNSHSKYSNWSNHRYHPRPEMKLTNNSYPYSQEYPFVHWGVGKLVGGGGELADPTEGRRGGRGG